MGVLREYYNVTDECKVDKFEIIFYFQWLIVWFDTC
jgi:hypothetical protein